MSKSDIEWTNSIADSLKFEKLGSVECVIVDESVYIGFYSGPVIILHPDHSVTSICQKVCELADMVLVGDYLWTASYETVLDVWDVKTGSHIQRIYPNIEIDFLFHWNGYILIDVSISHNVVWLASGSRQSAFEEPMAPDLNSAIWCAAPWNDLLWLGLCSGWLVAIDKSLNIKTFADFPSNRTLPYGNYPGVCSLVVVNNHMLIRYAWGDIFEMNSEHNFRFISKGETVIYSSLLVPHKGVVYITELHQHTQSFGYPDPSKKGYPLIATSQRPFMFSWKGVLFLLDGLADYTMYQLEYFDLWTPSRHKLHPKENRATIKTLFLLSHVYGNPLSRLPLDLVKVICAYAVFENLLWNIKKHVREYRSTKSKAKRFKEQNLVL